MKEIENIKKKFVLGISGKLIECYLLDSREQIKAANETITDAETETVFSLLEAEIARIEENNETEIPYYDL